jgi:hypothetical protein
MSEKHNATYHGAEPTEYDQHPGRDCCESCLQDAEFDAVYSMWPKCCCRSVWDE